MVPFIRLMAYRYAFFSRFFLPEIERFIHPIHPRENKRGDAT